MNLEKLQDLSFRSFLKTFSLREVSADKMLNKAKGPVWHKKHKKAGIIPKGLRGVDKSATWGKSEYDGWVYGHGCFSIVVHSRKKAFLGVFKYIPNCAYEAKRMFEEVKQFGGLFRKVFMDGKADSLKLFSDMREMGMTLITSPRKNRNEDSSPERREMLEFLSRPSVKREYRKRSTYVEPMQGVVKDIFDLDVCWMRGDSNNRWLFAAMGVCVQIAQWDAARRKTSTWAIKEAVLNQ